MRIFVSYYSRDVQRVERVVDELKTLRPDWNAYFAPAHNALGAYWITPLQGLVDLARVRVGRANVLSLEYRCALYLTTEGCP